MKVLLDTHAFLWLVSNDPQLPGRFYREFKDPANQLFLSVVSVWEAVIKYARGKLPLPGAPAVCLPQERLAHGIESLVVEEDDLPFVAALPPLHNDPFDRLLIAQALRHGMTLATVDTAVRAYPVPLLPMT